jgi:hypothetical protein
LQKGHLADPEHPGSIEPVILQLKDWFQNHTHRMLLIRKQEDGDRDVVRIQLDEVGYRPNQRSIDGYVDGPKLVLHGTGAVVTGAVERPLPGERYEISLGGVELRQMDAEYVKMQSDRAQYEVTPIPSHRL